MTTLEQLRKNIKNIDIDAIVRIVLSNPKVQQFIIDLNTKDQLFEKGENRLGIKLESIGGAYSLFTIRDKQSKGLPFDRITLFDTGDYYKSHIISLTSSELIIESDPIKGDTNLYQEWGPEIVGLQEENLNKVIASITDAFRENFREAILRGL